MDISPMVFVMGGTLTIIITGVRKLLPQMFPVEVPGWITPWIGLALAFVLVCGWPHDEVWTLGQFIINALITWLVAMGVWSGGKAIARK